ncbi:MAG: hypothetical protein ACKV2T_40075 [Kofleriaceae bacterium]
MRGAAPSVVCPRCGNESPPSGAGRFMTCAKCGMSIDAQAGERQQAVRGRVKEKPETEIDPSLPRTPSKFPFALSLAALVAILGIAIGAVVYVRSRPPELSDEQRENLAYVKQMQAAYRTLWDSTPAVHESVACRHLADVVARPCKPTVNVDVLALDQAVLALAQPGAPFACVNAVTAFTQSRIDAKCD